MHCFADSILCPFGHLDAEEAIIVIDDKIDISLPIETETLYSNKVYFSVVHFTIFQIHRLSVGSGVECRFSLHSTQISPKIVYFLL